MRMRRAWVLHIGVVWPRLRWVDLQLRRAVVGIEKRGRRHVRLSMYRLFYGFRSEMYYRFVLGEGHGMREERKGEMRITRSVGVSSECTCEQSLVLAYGTALWYDCVVEFWPSERLRMRCLYARRSLTDKSATGTSQDSVVQITEVSTSYAVDILHEPIGR